MTGEKMEELDIREVIAIIRKNLWIIILFTLLAAILSGIISTFFLSEVYASSTTLIVSKKYETTDQLQLSDVNLARNLVDTYSVIIKSNRVLEKVISNYSNLTLGQLKSKISVSSEGNTEVLRIRVEDEIPERAADIANSLANVFIEEVNQLLKMENVQVIDVAKTSYAPVRPRVKMNIAVAALVGLMVGVGIAFLREFLDNTIKTPEDVQKYLDLPVIGMIPDLDENGAKKR